MNPGNDSGQSVAYESNACKPVFPLLSLRLIAVGFMLCDWGPTTPHEAEIELPMANGVIMLREDAA
jgi:hypothetical protein